MKDHRIRLTDSDLAIITSALRARLAMTSGVRRHELLRILARLEDLAPGNPQWRLDELAQTKVSTTPEA